MSVGSEKVFLRADVDGVVGRFDVDGGGGDRGRELVRIVCCSTGGQALLTLLEYLRKRRLLVALVQVCEFGIVFVGRCAEKEQGKRIGTLNGGGRC